MFADVAGGLNEVAKGTEHLWGGVERDQQAEKTRDGKRAEGNAKVGAW